MRRMMSVALGSIAVLMGLGGCSNGHASERTISLIQRVTKLTVVDLGDKGESTGDQQSFAADLYQLEPGNKAGEKLGRSGVVITTVSLDQKIHDGQIVGMATYVLPGGKITAQTLTRFSDSTFTAAITGGTGSYRNARGEVELKDIPSSENDGIVIIHLIGD